MTINLARILPGATAVIVMAAMVTACAPNRALTKEKIFKNGRENHVAKADYINDDEEEFVFEDENVSGRPVKRESRGEKRVTRIADEVKSSKKESFYQTGISSWYGREFHGKMTASGERFNMKDLTAAHRTLPFGSVLMVKNLDNGKTVKVRINDRGPFKKDRILDLSYEAAKRLDMLSGGEAVVGINVLKGGSTEKSGDSMDVEASFGDSINDSEDMESDDRQYGDTGSYSIQAGAFYSRKKAQGLKEHIEEFIDRPVVIIQENEFYKVRIEGLRSRKEADRYRKKLENDSIPSYVRESNE